MSEDTPVTYNKICSVCSARWASDETALDGYVHIGLCAKHADRLPIHDPRDKARRDSRSHKLRMGKKSGSYPFGTIPAKRCKESRHSRGSTFLVGGIKTIPTVEMKQAHDYNVCTASYGWRKLVIKIRKCISCQMLFESISARMCGCMSAEYLTPATLMGTEMIYADTWGKSDCKRRKGRSDGAAPDDKLPSYGNKRSISRQWVSRNVPRSGYDS